MTGSEPMTGSEGADASADQERPFGRRTVLVGGVGAAAAAVILGGCGDDSSAPGADPTSESDSEPSSEPASEPPAGSGTELGPAADVAVGGGVIFNNDDPVVVTQPTEGEFRAFGANCTHAGCLLASVTETINCDCHGSKFSIEDGSVVSGPAEDPLPAREVSVDGDTITLL
jgi:Rieske Fe-S protein